MSPAVRVLHFIDSGGLYGAESVLLNLSEEMRAGGRFEPVVGCVVPRADTPSDLHDEAVRRGIEAHRVVIRNGLLPLDLPRAARKVKELGIGIVHSHGYKPSVFASAIRALGGPVPMATCHLWSQGDQPLKMRIMVAVELRCYRGFPVVVAVSQDIRRILLDAGVDDGRVEVVPNGIPVEAPAMAPERLAALRGELGLDDGRPCLLAVGRLAAQKAHDVLVGAAARLAARGRPAHVLIVGDGPLRSDLQGRIDAAGLDADVQLLGFRRDMDALLAVADLFVMPSRDEGMPMALLEAVAARVPVVATDVGDIGRVIADGRSGWIVPQDDAEALAGTVAAALDDEPGRRDRAAAAHAALVAGYSQAAMHDRYERIYAGLSRRGG